MRVIEVVTQGPVGPQGPAGPQGSSAPFTNIGNGVYATTSSLQVSGSFLISGSSTFTNIGPTIFSGSVNISGSAIINGDNILTTANTGSLNVLSSSYASTASLAPNYVLNSATSSFITNTQTGSFATTGSNQFDGNQTITGSLTQGAGSNIASGDFSHAEGLFTTASGNYSHAEGQQTLASGFSSHAEGVFTIASADGSHAEGITTLASGLVSHAEGSLTTASGQVSHAEGVWTISSGDFSHAEGAYAQSIGSYSHAEGNSTQAIGTGSHAEGYLTIAAGNYQHVQGLWNVTSSISGAFIVGNGTDDSNRSNLIHAAGNEFQITGSLSISGSLTLSSGSALNINDRFYVNGNKQFNYGAFSSTQTQIGLRNSILSMSFNTTDVGGAGVSLVDNTKLRVENTGIYNLQFSAQLDRSTSGTNIATIWFAYTGSSIANSATDVTITGGAAANPLVSSWNYILPMSASSYIEIYWSHNDNADDDIELRAVPIRSNPTRPAVPSVIATLTQIA